MKNSSSPIKMTYDTTPATLGDLDIWGGRIVEMIDEAKGEVKTELKAEFNKRFDATDARIGRLEDKQNDTLLLVKSIDKKLSKK